MLFSGSFRIHNRMPVFLLAIPLTLSAFTHIWNAVGFPVIRPDEGVLLERTMHVLNGLGPQESERNIYAVVLYDHPYFGQIFLASVFKIIGFPDFFLSLTHTRVAVDDNIAADIFTMIETLYLIPRIFVGILAVIDTFLVYKIAQSYYNSKIVSLISSTLFAVAPANYLLRTISLESILLPFLLLSILLAVHLKKYGHLKTNSDGREVMAPIHNNKKNISVILLSGISLGLAIFTKIPSFTMIPLVAFLVFTYTKRSLKFLGIWLIPVIFIPAIWPAYAIYHGEINLWFEGISYQATQRIELPLADKIVALFTLDPVFLIIGLLGLVYAAIKKDIMLLFWVLPFTLFLYLVGFSLIYHLVPILPAFCIAGAKLISDMLNQIIHVRWKKKIEQMKIATFVIVSAVLMWELVNTTMLITMDFNSWEFEKFAFALNSLTENSTGNEVSSKGDININKMQNATEILSYPVYSWIFDLIQPRERLT
jgi:4-amino-4-deoxy-L-arabinose transferase-like glycosyltransferase